MNRVIRSDWNGSVGGDGEWEDAAHPLDLVIGSSNAYLFAELLWRDNIMRYVKRDKSAEEDMLDRILSLMWLRPTRRPSCRACRIEI